MMIPTRTPMGTSAVESAGYTAARKGASHPCPFHKYPNIAVKGIARAASKVLVAQTLSDDVGDQIVFDLHDLIFQRQLLLFKTP